MEIKELKENEPLKIVEVLLHIKRPDFSFKEGVNPELFEEKQIQMRVFTDGEIAGETKEISENINEYYIGNAKYKYKVDTLKTKNIFFKNHSYVITYLIANEWGEFGNVRGWFNIVKDVTIYLENPKDKKALKTAKEVIREIQKSNDSVDYSSLYKMAFSPRRGLEQFESKRISKNIYSLKRKNKR